MVGFCYSGLTLEIGGFELALTITFVFQANQLTKYASHPKCLHETSLNSSFDRDDDRLKMEGYNLIRLDNPSGLKKEAYLSTIRNIFLLLWETISVL